MHPEDMMNLYFIVRKGSNERVMCCNEAQPFIIDDKTKAEEYAGEYNENIFDEDDINTKYIAMSVLDFVDKFGYS